MKTSAASKVLNIPELGEMILCHLELEDLLLWYNISKYLGNLISGSQQLQQTLVLERGLPLLIHDARATARAVAREQNLRDRFLHFRPLHFVSYRALTNAIASEEYICLSYEYDVPRPEHAQRKRAAKGKCAKVVCTGARGEHFGGSWRKVKIWEQWAVTVEIKIIAGWENKRSRATNAGDSHLELQRVFGKGEATLGEVAAFMDHVLSMGTRARRAT